MNWFLGALKKYAVFAGRARRKEYWYFALFYTLIYLVLIVIDIMTGTFVVEWGAGALAGIFMLGMIVPSISVMVRRLHDTDRSGWWWFLVLIPLLGGIWLLVLLVLDGTPSDNRFGPDPKGFSA